MRRTARDKRDLPHPPPVEHIELNEEHIGRRLILVAALLVVGGAALAYGFWQLMTPQSEWITVEAETSAGATCAEDFVFLYHLGGGEQSFTAERKAVTAAYTQLCREAFEQFHNQMEFEGVNNLYAINRHPNEELTVGRALYNAFAAVERSGNRAIYLGPVYDRYESIFACEDDVQIVDFDPRVSPEVAREYADYAAYANDPASVRVELLGENRICLRVSEAYLAYAQQEGIESFIDFSWMRNAFIADYLADELAARSYGRGALSAYDGFMRNLDSSGLEYSLQLYALHEGTVYPAALMNYKGPLSAVSLRDYPNSEADQVRFYQLRTGEIRTPYLDPADGLCRSAVHDLTCYARDKSCGEVLLSMLPVYIADSFRPEALEALAAEGIQSVYCENGVICPSDADIVLTQLFESKEMRFTVSQAAK